MCKTHIYNTEVDEQAFTSTPAQKDFPPPSHPFPLSPPRSTGHKLPVPTHVSHPHLDDRGSPRRDRNLRGIGAATNAKTRVTRDAERSKPPQGLRSSLGDLGRWRDLLHRRIPEKDLRIRQNPYMNCPLCANQVVKHNMWLT